LAHAFAQSVRYRLRAGVPLVGGLAIQCYCRSEALWHALAIGVDDPEVVLSAGMPLLGSLAKPSPAAE
jgi:hypothetical protein